MESVDSRDPSSDANANFAKPTLGEGPPIHWTVSPGEKAAVTGDNAPDWSDLVNDPSATLVKSNTVRQVWRIRRDDRDWYVKDFGLTSTRAGLRQRLRGSDAHIEYRAGHGAAERGVPCVRVIAHGESRRRSLLVTEAVSGAATLADAWQEACESSSRGRLDGMMKATAGLLAKAHTAGFLHGDDHPRNILIAPDGDGAARAVYVDVARAREKSGISDTEAAASVAQLHQWFRLRSERHLRLRFLWTYCVRRSSGDARSARQLLRRISPIVYAETHTQAARLWAKRDRRILGTNAYFARIALPGGARAHVTLRFRQRALFPMPSLPDQAVDAWQARIDTLEHCTDVVARGDSSHQEAFVAGHRLRNRDLPCRWPAAMVTATGETSDILWVDANPRTKPLSDHMADIALDVPARRRVVASLARISRLMSDRGVCLGTAPDTAFGVTPDGDVIIDAPTAVILSHRDPVRDGAKTSRALYELAFRGNWFRRTDAIRYLKALGADDWKAMWRLVASTLRSF